MLYIFQQILPKLNFTTEYFRSSIFSSCLRLVSCPRLRQIDLELMRRLHSKVNIVPVIAKADTLTAAEVKKLKQRILQDIEDNQIQVSV